MPEDSNHSESCIMLSPAVLDQLKSMSVGQLKVYIYLCACYEGQPFPATIPQLTAATGIQTRAAPVNTT